MFFMVSVCNHKDIFIYVFVITAITDIFNLYFSTFHNADLCESGWLEDVISYEEMEHM